VAAKKASAEKAADTVVTEEVEVTGSDSDSVSDSFSDSDSVSDSDSESESEGGDATADDLIENDAFYFY